MFVLYLIVFVGLMGVGVIIPLLPFFGEKVGASAAEITLLMSAFALGQFVSSPFWGWLSDRVGRRPVLIATMAGSAFAYGMLGFSESIGMLLLARLLAGLMAGNVAVAFAAASDVTSSGSRSAAMGRIGASFALGFIFGPAIGGLLSGSDTASTDFVMIGLVAGGLSALAFLLAVFSLNETLPPAKRSRRRGPISLSGIAASLTVMRRSAIGVLIAVNFIYFAAGSMVDSTFSLFAYKAHGFGPNDIGYLFTFMGVIMAIVQGLAIGPVSNRIGDAATVRLGIVLYGLGLAGLVMAWNPVSILAALALLSAGNAFYVPSSSSVVSQQADPGTLGSVIGVFQAAGNLGRVATPLVSGLAFDMLGMTSPYIIALLLLLPAVWLLQTAIVRLRSTASTGQ